MNKRGRPRSPVKKYKSSIKVPENFVNTLYLCEKRYPAIKGMDYSAKLVYILEQVAKGD